MVGEARLRVRLARPTDKSARADVVHAGFASLDKQAFFFLLIQELTLECCILCGAVLFIWCGVSARGCLLAAPLVAAVMALAVRVAHGALAQKHAQEMCTELFGVVAEVTSPVSHTHQKRFDVAFDLNPEPADNGSYAQIIGTASVVEARSGNGAWLRAFAVHPRHQGCGVGSALCAAVRHAADQRVVTLHAVVSELQGSARTLLHKHGWECRGQYARQLVGPALTLHLAALELSPYAHR